MIKDEESNLNNSIAFITAMILTIGVIFCLSFIKDQLNLAAILANYDLNINDFVAEKSEKFQYIFGTLSFPVFFIIAQSFMNKKDFQNPKYKKVLGQCAFTLVILLTFIVFICTPPSLNVLFYLKFNSNGNLTNFLIVFPVIIMILLLLLFALYERFEKVTAELKSKGQLKKRIFDAVIYTAAAANLIYTPYLYITKTYYFNHTVTSAHFDAYFYPVYKVFCGQTPLVDFDNLYGFYPYFLVPFFKLIGGITMLRFSIVMAGLIFIILLAMTIVLFKICKNRFLALLGSLTFSFVVAIMPMLYGQVYYLQYFPHRTLFPVLMVLICFISVRLKNKKAIILMTIVGYVVSVLALLWNLDTGVVVLAAFAAYRLFLLLQKYKLNESGFYRRLTGIILCTILCAAAYITTLIIITYERTGKLLKVDDILYSQTNFYGAGYYMLRMPLFAPWLLLAVIYAVSLAKGLRNTKFLSSSPAGQVDEKAMLSFLFPVIGMGIFSYYQGRSHFYVLLAIVWPGIILLIMKMDEYWIAAQARTDKESQYWGNNKTKFIAAFVFMAFFLGNIFTYIGSPDDLQRVKSKSHYTADNEINPIIQMVKDVRVNNEPIDLITYHSAAIYCVLKDTRIINIPATIDWFTKADYQRVFDYMAQTKNKVIIDTGSMDNLKKYEPEKLDAALKRFTFIEQTKAGWVYESKR